MEVAFFMDQSGGGRRDESQARPAMGGASKLFTVKCQKVNTSGFPGPYVL